MGYFSGEKKLSLKASKFNRMMLKNRYVLRNDQNCIRAQKNRVNLNAWITSENEWDNVGDYLSFVVVDELCKLNNISLDKPVRKTKHLYAIGSILMGYQDATVWGSGFGYDRPAGIAYKIDSLIHRIFHKIDIRSVRGPETRRILLSMGIECPEIYGDPAVLMPMFYKGNVTAKRNYVLIPHYSRFESYQNDPCVISTFTPDYKKIIDQIVSADLVISSSLHGIILAEAYGVPAVMLKDTPSSDITKYKDWYYSTGRYDFPVANTVEEALNTTPCCPDASIIESMRKNLLDAFPLDLWND